MQCIDFQGSKTFNVQDIVTDCLPSREHVLIMCANGTEENIFVAHNYYFTYFHNCKTRDLTHNTAFDIPI